MEALLLNGQALLTLGAGGISFLVVMVMLFKIPPLLNSIKSSNDLNIVELKSDSQLNRDLLERLIVINEKQNENLMDYTKHVVTLNESIIKEIKDSNYNVSQTLAIVATSQGSIVKLIEKSDDRMHDFMITYVENDKNKNK